jgi:hypothetical protein
MTATQTASTESKPAEARASAAQVESEVATHPLHAATGHTLAGGGGVHGVGEAPTTSLPHPLALCHRNIGNQAVLRSLSASRPIIQTKLTVNQPGDQYEREADRVAEQVMHKPDAGSVGLVTSNAAARGMQRKYHYGGSWDQSSDGVDVTNVTLQRAGTDDFGHVEAPPNAHEVLRSTGLPLDKATRAYFEPRFGVSLSDVRVHTDKSAEQSAADLGANAYTVGYDIVFGAGRFAPSVSEGGGG